MKDHLGLSKKSPLLTVATLASITAILVIVSLTGFALYKSESTKANKNKIILQNIPKDAEADLIKIFSNQEDIDTSQKYHSKDLGITFTYDPKQFNLFTQKSAISFTLADQKTTSVVGRLSFLDRSANDPVSNRAAYYENLYKGVKKDEEGTTENLPYAKLSFVQENPLNQNVKALVNKLVIYREIDDRYFYAEVAYPQDYKINDVSSSLAKLLASTEITDENIEEEKKQAEETEIQIDGEIILENSEILSKLSEAAIFTKICIQPELMELSDWANFNGNEYEEICTTNVSSGNFISQSGEFLANSNYVRTASLDVLINSFWGTNFEKTPFWGNFLTDLKTKLSSDLELNASELTRDQLFLFAVPTILQLDESSDLKLHATYENYIQQVSAFSIDQESGSLTNPAEQLSTELLASLQSSDYKQQYLKATGKSTNKAENITVFKTNGATGVKYPVNSELTQEEKVFIVDNKISDLESSVSSTVELALSNIQKGYYSTAKNLLMKAKREYPYGATILDPLINIAEDKIEKGEDSLKYPQLIPIEDFIQQNFGIQFSSDLTAALTLAAATFLLSTVTILAISFKRGRDALKYKPPVVGNQSITPMDQQTQNGSPIKIDSPMIQEVTPVVGNPDQIPRVQMPDPPSAKPGD